MDLTQIALFGRSRVETSGTFAAGYHAGLVNTPQTNHFGGRVGAFKIGGGASKGEASANGKGHSPGSFHLGDELAVEKMVEKEFEMGKVLGEGNYAEVKLSKEKATGHMWAMKIINKKKLEVRSDSSCRARRPLARDRFW